MINRSGLVGCLFVFFCQTAAAQLHSPYGSAHTPLGRLHILVIVVRFEDENRMPWDRNWPDNDSLPDFMRGEANSFFCADPSALPEGQRFANMSDFFYRMSGGKFILSADIYPQQVPVAWIPEDGRNAYNRQERINRAAVEWIRLNDPGFDWNRYDQRENQPAYRIDNSQSKPDGILDYVVFMHRNPGNSGMGTAGAVQVPGLPFRIRDGHTAAACRSSEVANWEFFKHEFAHNLYDAPHYMGANHTDGSRLYVQRGWGMMSDGAPPFFTTNAWENWRLGWRDTPPAVMQGIYSLRDFVQSGDAMRIALPGTRDELWLENHRLRDFWDNKKSYNDSTKPYPKLLPGIYAYVVAAPGNDLSRPLQTFNPDHCNLIKVLSADGAWDYAPCGHMVKNIFFTDFALRRLRPNPIAGQNDMQAIRWDSNDDGFIEVGMTHGNNQTRAGEMTEVWALHEGDACRATYNVHGDEGDAFRPGSAIGINGAVPALNFPRFLNQEQRLEAYVLNGLLIEILDEDEQGTIRLRLRFDDWTLRESRRWCGPMLLPPAETTRDNWLGIGEGATLSLELSGTAGRQTRDSTSGNFANPTVLEISSGRGLRVMRGGVLDIAAACTLRLKGNAVLEVEEGALLRVQPGGSIVLEDESRLVLRRRGRIAAEKGAVVQHSGASISVAGRWRKAPAAAE